MDRDPSTVEAALVTLVRELSRRAGRPADEAEVRAALAPLTATEEAALRRIGKGAPPATPLGPRAWADIARGTSAAVAAARELGGFYELQAERDALASMVRAQKPAARAEVGAAEKGDPRDSAGEDDEREDRGDDDVTGPDDDSEPVKPARAAAKPPRDPFDDEPLPSPAKETRKAARKAATARAAAKVRPPPDALDRVLVGPPVAKKPLPPSDKKARAAAFEERSQQVLTLFAYHRDAPLVARALGVSMDQLEQEVDLLKIRRQSRALLRGTDIELPKAASRQGAAASEPVRRRAAGSKEAAKKAKEAEAEARAVLAAATPAEPEPDPVTEPQEEPPPPPPRTRLPVTPAPGQAEPLKALLREVGPRRKQLCEKLGSARSPLSTAALLARFRAAGLEREFGQRERDLVRALLSRHRGALGPAAAELDLTPKELQDVVRERGLTREVETLRDKQRRAAHDARWPQARIELWLRQRDWLADLGLWDELDKEIDTRVRLAWKGLPPAGKKRSALLARNLRIAPADAEALVVKLKLT